MSNIFLGDISNLQFKVGSGDCKVYLGSTLLYPSALKYKLTLSNGDEVTVPCDGTSAITSGDVSAQYSGTVVSAEIGDCVTSIGNRTFYYCKSLSSVTIPNSVTSIGNKVFQNCISLTSVTIPSGVTVINYQTFDSCSGLTSVNIPNGVTSIGNDAFYNCRSLVGINIPNSVTSIASEAFSGCRSLTSIIIPDSVTSIGTFAFSYNQNLNGIACLATTPPTLGSYAFNSTNNCPIYVPSGSLAAYKAASGWSDYASRIQALYMNMINNNNTNT